ncbi:MAG: 50S ribosomal protein L29 [Candidatus Pacebacteria bacterium]|nr:50S ribosomal protein L29 [Candidatus Paceibacterota bacterium]
MSSELNKKTEKEIEKIITEKREKLREFRFSAMGTKIKNIKEGSNLRKDLARALTETRRRELKD